jgi:hypothetical protein
MLKREFSEAILNGSKKSTIRIGIVKPRYKEVIIHSGGRPIGVVEILGVSHKRIRDLSLEEIKEDGFESIEDLIKALRRLYPREEVDLNTIVTVIKFELIKRLDHSSREGNKEISPGLLARIALRYLKNELSKDEKRILLELTKTNSIRKTAYVLYGDPLDRTEIRRVLRSVYKKLKNHGIL